MSQIFSARQSQRAAASPHGGPLFAYTPQAAGPRVIFSAPLNQWQQLRSRRRPASSDTNLRRLRPESDSSQLGKNRVGDTLLSQIFSAPSEPAGRSLPQRRPAFRVHSAGCWPECDLFGTFEPMGSSFAPGGSPHRQMQSSADHGPSMIIQHLRISEDSSLRRTRRHCGPPRPQAAARRAPRARLFSSFRLCKSRRAAAFAPNMIFSARRSRRAIASPWRRPAFFDRRAFRRLRPDHGLGGSFGATRTDD